MNVQIFDRGYLQDLKLEFNETANESWRDTETMSTAHRSSNRTVANPCVCVMWMMLCILPFTNAMPEGPECYSFSFVANYTILVTAVGVSLAALLTKATKHALAYRTVIEGAPSVSGGTPPHKKPRISPGEDSLQFAEMLDNGRLPFGLAKDIAKSYAATAPPPISSRFSAPALSLCCHLFFVHFHFPEFSVSSSRPPLKEVGSSRLQLIL